MLKLIADHYTAQYIEHSTTVQYCAGEVLSESGNVVNDHDLVSAVVSCWERYIDDHLWWQVKMKCF